ncbi:polycomb group RING finger protein 5-B [Nematostella vectensis]|uniref:polycomb group RING finger protein 5-B n=1 Tax=Nematostella vectensis TaxID=45351 RepID=UPI00138FA481|nr:polycomb group RING finger protein 5-B [Nematostella vectensis]
MMAILQSNRERKLQLRELNPHITCGLCRGYLIKPTTITECLHTFCRSCIILRFQDGEVNLCPTCNILIHETNPLEMLRSDKTLEDIIYKLVPGLQEDEIRRTKEFYESCPKKRTNPSADGEEAKGRDSLSPPCKVIKTEGDTSALHRKPVKDDFHRSDPQIGVCLECCGDSSTEENVKQLNRKFIKCSSRMTIAHVKKYLKLKLSLKTADQVEVMCNGEIMGKDHTLEFVYMTRWRVKEGSILSLQYRPRIDFT